MKDLAFGLVGALVVVGTEEVALGLEDVLIGHILATVSSQMPISFDQSTKEISDSLS